MIVVRLRYQFRVYPSAPQRIELAKAFGCARVVWNDALRIRRDAYEQGKPLLSIVALAKQVITEAKKTPERAWLGEVSAVVLQSSLRDLQTAFGNFFASMKGTRKGPKVGPPRFKKKTGRQAVRFTKAARFSVAEDGRLRLPKIGDVHVRWSRDLPSAPSSVTIVKDPAGRYFASFVVETEDKLLAELDAEETDTGIDLGLSTYAVLRGRKIASPKFFRRQEKKLRRAQRKLSRCTKGSNNRRKAKLAVAKIHARIADRRRDFIEQETTRVTRESQAVYLEDLNVKGMAKTYGKSLHDQSLGMFSRTLEAKCTRYGRTFVKVDRFFPSTQLCSHCGALSGPKGQKGLKIRAWTCDCGARHDRDRNAEYNLRLEGRRIVAAGRADT
ncbi:RNA-guided endonuclease InsQ/TnpB family protein [Streptomyces sp. NPDC048337]|uniref:RNA-guided endonuclease InsQ/TnpB family protein n=1 Tax=Streptomyces sp. NPDC048337 TaxID=3365535 RepID=UPI00371BBFBB